MSRAQCSSRALDRQDWALWRPAWVHRRVMTLHCTSAIALLRHGKVWHTRAGDKARSHQATAWRRAHMEAKKGDGLLMVYCDVPAEHEEEFNRWYNEEHIPERLAIP